MQTWNEFIWTSVHDLPVGAIARAKGGGGMFTLLKLPSDDENRARFGILATGDPQYLFRWVEIVAPMPCISIGQNWLLEHPLPEDIEFFPDNSNRYNLNTPACFSEWGYGFKFAPGPGQGMMADELHYWLSREEVSDRHPTEAAPVSRWSIWTSEKHRMDPGASPLISFGRDEATATE